MSGPRLTFADGRRWELGRRTAVMGILNGTPDSFSDGGRFASPREAVAAGLAMFREGADIVDVGGESTRPGADAVDPADERDRVIPIIRGLRSAGAGRISVDTRRAEVAHAALDAGADLVNDVSGLDDPEMASLVAERGVPVVIMHMRGTPRTMQQHTAYDDVVATVKAFLAERVQRASAAGVADDKILVDPGIGFGKSADGNLELLRRLDELAALHLPILVGASRKSFIGAITGAAAGDRRQGSIAAAIWAATKGAAVVRVHDVRETVEALAVCDAIRHGDTTGAPR